MRVLFLSYFYEYYFGGAEAVARTLRSELLKQGHVVDVLCLAGGPAVQPEKIWRLPLPQWLLRHPQVTKRALLFLNNSFFDQFFFSKAQRLRLPMESYDLIHCQDAFCLLLGNRLASRFKKPLALTLHDNYPRRIIDDLTHPLATKALQAIAWRRDQKLKSSFRTCRWIAAVSKHVAKNAIAFLEPDPPPVFTVYNPYPVALAKTLSAAHLNSPPQVLFIGRISREKGIDLLVEALRGYDRSICLTVLGLDGPLKKEIEKAARADTRILIEPPVPYEQVHRFIEQHDLICSPSNWDEPFGLTVLEARIHGKPILTTDRGGIPEILTGYTRASILNTKGQNRSQLVSALRNALQPAIDLAMTPLDEAAEEKFLRQFSTETFAHQYAKLYTTGSPN